ncbi:methylmalonyl-CoA mutase [Candidatus Kryptonium thompsonii]|uniref:Methylmalonyl-CoA mutase n=2 Tax=Candidatus Kryptonium thompsonii TaxID=1633631 RepID=A0A0P1LMD2_9BACT|nr:methylmalonyl-CoA mutase [Candidatus Kryptonium thompsoni]CUS82481.1 methylmalonyl-CoA mutase [Candidatus Kryptonium thompsoni]CUS82588.1 methylmalonyl-CoA mutase [Candidatus Kryptonium thompsoni]CUS94926.1 methylmalonyl-CoA mutase [Candidatus Kryptonium thompsoni]CUT05886.1 methylmalonyl-CoA mutase [Candidatus Kryptonium thompsoni]
MAVNLKEMKKEWENKFLNSGKFKERKDCFKTDSGIEIERIYLPDESFDYATKLGFPGEYPYTRGIYPTMYRGRIWTMRQYAGFGTAEETNKRFKYLLEHGQMGLSVAFDLPTQMGYDSDHPMAEGEVGRVGVAIDSLQDMEILFDGINLEKITTSMTINATAAILLAMYVAVAKKQGADLKKISGTIQNDILKEYIARGTYIYPPQQSMKLIVDIFQWCNENLPKWNVISISGYHIREAGANAVQELAFTFANAIEYVRSAIKAGLDVNKFGEQLSFFFNAHNNFFEEIAKFRAARRIWAKIMREKFGVTNEEAMKLRFHAQTGGSTLTAQQIENNIVRVTIQALAAVLGGCQSLHTNSKDEALALPTEESARLALRTQQIIAYESGVTDTIDPLAGSYFVEYLTDEIEKRVWEYIEKIEAMGGAIKAIEAGYIQNEIAKSAYEYQMQIERKEKIIVGVNEFKTEEKQKIEIFKLNESAIKNQIERLKKLRKERDNGKVMLALKRLRESALLGENLIPPIIECVEAYATIGEISDTLREIWGEYREI